MFTLTMLIMATVQYGDACYSIQNANPQTIAVCYDKDNPTQEPVDGTLPEAFEACADIPRHLIYAEDVVMDPIQCPDTPVEPPPGGIAGPGERSITYTVPTDIAMSRLRCWQQASSSGTIYDTNTGIEAGQTYTAIIPAPTITDEVYCKFYDQAGVKLEKSNVETWSESDRDVTITWENTVPPVMGEASLWWTPPTTNEDGSDLTDLASYTVYYGPAPGNYPNQITGIPGAFTTVTGLGAGPWAFTVTAVDTSGNESNYSNIATKIISQ